MYVQQTWIAGLILTVGLPPLLQAQYFGQNKVRYRTFDFKVLKTEHFDIYYYDEEEKVMSDFARMAERWYQRLSTVFDYELSSRQPIVVYANHTDFRGTTVIPGYIGETTGGITEGLRRRVVMPLAGSMGETDHVLGHELVHAFQFDITSRIGPEGGVGLPGSLRLPLWFVEGMAEYLSLGPIDSHTAMWMRDAVRREKIPKISDLDDPEYFSYRYGQAFWAYVGGRYGDEVIGNMLKAAGRARSAEGAFAVLKVSSEDLSKEWRQALLNEYEPVLKETRPIGEQARVLASERKSGGELHVSPVLSPDGTRVAFFSERGLFSINLYIADADSGEILHKVTESAIDPHFDSMQFVSSAGAWSADGRRFAFGSIRSGRPVIAIYDTGENDVTDRIPLENLGEVFSPAWSPDGRQIAFSANQGGVSNLYVLDVQRRNIRELTNDVFADLQPAWSPDGATIAFVTDRFTSDADQLEFGDYRLALLDVQSGNVRPLSAFPRGKHINPQWSPESGGLFFVSDRDGISNVYRLEIATGRITQITNLATGATGITQGSPALSVAANAERLAFSAFLGGDYNIYVVDSAAALAGYKPLDNLRNLHAAALPPRERASGEVARLINAPTKGLIERKTFPVKPYEPSLSLDYIAPPMVSAGVSSFGAMIGGGTALYFSDLLGYHNLMTAFQTSTVGDASNFLNNLSGIVSYQNQKHRWNWGFIGGQIPFLTGGLSRGVGTVEGEPVIIDESVTFWQINRQLAGTLSYPFNRAQRVEFTLGYQNISFDGERRIQAFLPTGQLVGEQTEDLRTPGGIHLGTTSAALVYDTSIFGGTSPVWGQRYRLELGGNAGTVSYATALADYRRYFRLAKPLTLAGRVMHLARYGGDAQDRRLQDLFIGYPSLVRGYDPGSFSPDECVSTTGGCPVFDQLLGSRMVVANAELRLALLGFLGVIPSRSLPPVELAPFFDAGTAWRSGSDIPDGRDAVKSYGASLRFNILGFAIGQLSYVRPVDRPRQGWMWQFSLLPGF